MDIGETAKILGLIVLAVVLLGSFYTFYKYLTADRVSILLTLKRTDKIVPPDRQIPEKKVYPSLVFEVSVTKDSKRDISIRRCYLQLDKKLKNNKLFKGLYKQHFKFDDEDLRFEYQSLQGNNLPFNLPSQFVCEVHLGNHHLLEYLLLTDVRLVLVDDRRNKFVSNYVKIDGEK
jgi:hypothetical protein